MLVYMHSTVDAWLIAADGARRALWGSTAAGRPGPRAEADALDAAQKKLSGALMRVNHVGEVCAQALYQAQALGTASPALKAHFDRASRDEMDHLAWTRRRLDELADRPSLLNPLWYAGAFAIGLAVGRLGDRASLGFVVETERQVEQHLASHLDRLPLADRTSRAIVEQMKLDEARHAHEAEQAGAMRLPAPARWLMRAAAKVMTTTALHV